VASTLLDVRTLVLQRAGMQNSKFVKTPEANALINSARRDLWTLFVAHTGPKSLTSDVQVTTVAGTTSYDIPRKTDQNGKQRAIYSVERVGVLLDNIEYPVRKKVDSEVYNFEQQAWDPATDFRYVLTDVDEALTILPIANAVYTVNVYCVWWPAVLADDADQFDDTYELPWMEYIVTQAAIQCRRKQESDTSGLERDKADIVERLMRWSEGVDQAGHHRIIDATRRSFPDGRLF
jgi:hypothetical protein